MTEKPKETPKEELECPKKYVYDTGIIFECKDNIRVQIIGEDVVDLLNELTEANEQLKSRIHRERELAMRLRREYDALAIKKQELELEIIRLEEIIKTGKR